MKSTWTLAVTSLLVGSAAGLALRHDVPEARYVELGASFPAVVQVAGLASGTLVAPSWVLTVAHAPEMIEKMRPGQPLQVTIGEASYTVSRVVVPPAREAGPEGPDIALLELTESVPQEAVEPLALWSDDVEAGTGFVLAGWGVRSLGDAGVQLSPALMSDPSRALRAGRNVVERVEEGLLVARFDAPETAVELEAGPCVGDSGGPALLKVEGEDGRPDTWAVAGVLAAIDDVDGDRVLGEYGDEFALTSVAAHADWIRATIAD